MSKEFLENPKLQTYSKHELEKFRTLLEKADAHTVQVPIQAADDILLTQDGRLQENGFTLSPLAFQQVCRYVARGLWPLVSDLSGTARSHRSYDSVISIPLAIRILNDCAKLRFRVRDGLCGRMMIQNHMTKVVDGVVGLRYKYLANYQLLEGAKDLLDSHEQPMVFHEGRLVGRRMAAVFLAEEPLGCTPDGYVLQGGCYFTNSEAGECGVRCAPVLQVDDDIRCIGPLRGIAHAGRSFMKRLGTMLVGVLGEWPKLCEIATNTEHLSKSLRLVKNDRLDRSQRRRLVTRLSDYTEKGLATAVVRRALLRGRLEDDTGFLHAHSPTVGEMEQRTINDLFIVLMETANGHYPEIREGLERAAFDILAQKFKP